MDLKSLLVALDRRTRFLDAAGLGTLRAAGRRVLAASVARSLAAEVEGLTLRGTIQHRSYLQRLQRGLAEPYTAQLLGEATCAGSSFVDVGAFLGYYTLRAAAAGARVVSVEANPATRALLDSNIRRNRLQDRVVVQPFAVSDHRGRVDYFIGDGDQSSSGLSSNRSNRRAMVVEARPLDDLVESADVMKIDVEGAEVQALAGMARLLDQNRLMTIVAECNPEGLQRMGSTPLALVRSLENRGFRVTAIDERNRRLQPWRDGLGGAAVYVNFHAVR